SAARRCPTSTPCARPQPLRSPCRRRPWRRRPRPPRCPSSSTASPAAPRSALLGVFVRAVLRAPGRSAPAVAADLADEAQFHFERGNQHYRQGRIEEALEAYYASNRLVENRNVQFNIARCLEQLRRHEEAFRAWAALEAQDPPAGERATIAAAIDRLRPFLALVRVESD